MTSLQKKLAAKVLKVGESKVWLDPTKTKDIEAAITKADIRKLIKKGYVKALPEKVKRPKEKRKRRRGPGRKKGAKHAIVTAKERWISTVRPLREMLKELRASNQIDKATYRRLYLLVKSGMFRSRSHLRIYLEQRGILKKK
ncbi:MAG: 50S ribosomal protein L19e [Candidatus Aenigmarchaeota archaeon]|nr:50S ribosomal protein L19e [Candidatus Aenigmarchaeota archaeon]